MATSVRARLASAALLIQLLSVEVFVGRLILILVTRLLRVLTSRQLGLKTGSPLLATVWFESF